MSAPDYSERWAAFYARREELRREREPSRADNPAEFDQLARHVRLCRESCGEWHAQAVAAGFQSDFGWNAGDLRAAAAQLTL